MNPTTTLSTPKSSLGTPTRLTSNGTPAPSDFTLYDKARLLRLAEQSQPRKSASPRNTQTHHRPTAVNGNTGFSTPLGKLEKLSNGTGTVRTKTKNTTASEFKTPSPSPNENNFSSKARSKLYASFSSKKSKLIKSDPAKTNIEHLVNSRTPSTAIKTSSSINRNNPSHINYYNGSDTSSNCSSLTNHCNSLERPVTPYHEEPVDTSFHNRAKLISAFSPTPSTLSSASGSSIHSLAKRSLGRNHNGKYSAMQNDISPTHEYGKSPNHAQNASNQVQQQNQPSPAATEHQQPRIASAQIVALSRTASFPSPLKNDDDFSSGDFCQPQAYNTKAIENQSRAAVAAGMGLHDGSSTWLPDTHAQAQSSPTKTTRRPSASTSSLSAAIILPPPIPSRKSAGRQSESETERQRRHVNGSSPRLLVEAAAEPVNSHLYSHDGMQIQTEFFSPSQSQRQNFQTQPQLQLPSPRRTSYSSGTNYYTPVNNVSPRSRQALVFNDNLTNDVSDSCVPVTATGIANHAHAHTHESGASYEWSRRGNRNTEAAAADIHKIANFYDYNRNVDGNEDENCAGAGACDYNYDVAVNDCEEDSNTTAEAATATTAEEDFDRKKTHSLPRSLTSMKTGLRNVKLPCLWNPHDQAEDASEGADQRTLIPHRHPEVRIAPTGTMLPKSTSVTAGSTERMNTTRQNQHQQSSQRTKGRPKSVSVDCSQRNSWMKVYSNMDPSSVNGNPSSKSPSPMNSPAEEKPGSSISRLHLIDSTEDVRNWRSAVRDDKNARILNPGDQRDSPDCSSGIGSNSSRSNSLTEQGKEPRPRLSSSSAIPPPSATSNASNQSLFQRFSKTFSLRFGGAKELEHQGSSRKKLKQNTRYLGSSPDLVSTANKRDSIDGKHRKGSHKAVRDNKCQSGDSGIQILDAESYRQAGRPITRSSNENRTSHLRNSMNRLSLVEFPNQTSRPRPNRQTSLLSTNTVSYEDLLEGKLDDDGFISHDEEEEELVQVDEENEDDGFNNNVLRKSPDNSYYHSLPAKYLRQKRTAKKATSNSPESIRVRGNIIKELLTTERNYVKILTDIVQGFLIPCRQAKHLFSPKIVSNIFSNIEDLLKLHVQFLHDLEHAIDQSQNQNPNESEGIQPRNYSSSLVGHVFIVWSDQFHHLYSDYCCQNTMSIVTLRQLTSMSSEYVDFFEICRRRQLMDKLPLHGFLLRPIQRICQYHLQLNELAKNTPVTHDDFEAVREALERMKLVATNVNETQRQFDALQELARLQISIEGFEGPDLLERNTLLLHQGDLVQMNQGSKHKEVYVIILNQEVIICRKDSAKKSALTMNTRIDLNSSVWVNIDSNEEDDYFGMVHNSWRLYNPYKCSWILFTASSPSDKRKWTSALEQTAEQDLFRISPKMREMAKLTATQILLTDSLLSYSSSTTATGQGLGAQNNTSTMPKLKKNGNRKSFTKNGNGDASASRTDLVINDIVKHKSKNSGINNSHSNNNNAPVRTSKFYV